MNCDFRRVKSERVARLSANTDHRTFSPFTLHPSNLRQSGLTLVELLVVIIILTTLVGGVIPVLSPNNDTRKIRAAARGLQGYITQIQARAARTGRPHGIAFRESAVNSGVAIEVFGWEVPPPFAGFSQASQVRVIQEVPPGVNPSPRYYVQFVLADARTNKPPEFPSREYDNDRMPPNFIRFLDEIHISGTIYRFVDFDFNGNGTPTPNNIPPEGYYSLDLGSHRLSTFEVLPVNANGQMLAFQPPSPYPQGNNTYYITAPQPYKLVRQPATSSEAPYQLPAGIAIDMQGSILQDANFNVQLQIGGNLLPPLRNAVNFPFVGTSLSDRDDENQDVVGIMFAPTGAVSEIYHNSLQVTGTSRAVLLLGRIENGSLTYTHADVNDATATVTDGAWTIARNATKNDLEDLQERVNWLNLDSRFLSIITNSGRAVVSEPAFVDATVYGDENANVQFLSQLQTAQGFAQEMTTVGGN